VTKEGYILADTAICQ